MNKCKLYLVSVISGLLLISAGSVFALQVPEKWSQLNQIEKRVLQSHATKWDTYNKNKQHRFFKQASKEIKRLNAYKKWFKEKLTNKERAIFYNNKKKMSPIKFRNYVDKLMKKYRMPK